MYSTRAQLLLVVVAALFTTACNQPPPAEQARLFCEALDRVNQGMLDTTGYRELDGHALVLKTLLDVAPEPIEDDMKQFHGAFAAWASAVSGEQSMLDTFEALTEPSLAGAEGRVGEYIAQHCGISLGDDGYRVAERPSAQSICPGWPRIGSPNTFNNFPNLPDIAGANYFANDFMITRFGLALGDAFAVEPGGWVEFRGQYPRARYFAFHPNDMDLNNLPTLRDQDLVPDPGHLNPFRPAPDATTSTARAEASDTTDKSAAAYFTAKLVFGPPPAEPAPNTRYVGEKKHGGTNRYVVNLLRLYASDLGNGANSGGVPLPAVTIYDADGKVTEHHEECDLYAKGGEQISTDLQFPVLPIADHRASAKPVWSTSSNFEAPSDTMANADVQYLSTVYSRRFGDIFIVRAKYLSGPDTRAGVAVNAAGYDTRMYTLCNYNIWQGSAIHCMLNTDLHVDEDGFYTLVIAEESNRPNNLEDQAATWMDWGPSLDGQVSFRHVFRENPKVTDIAAALNGEKIAAENMAYVPHAYHCSRTMFEQGGWRACLPD